VTLFILDTDHLSLYQRDVEPLVSKLLSHPPIELAITIVTVEEQLRGRLAQIRKATTAAHLSERYRWLGETVDQLARLPVVYVDDKAVTIYERLLLQKLRIGTQDLLIASIVLSQNAVLLTRNNRDFSRVPSLRLDDWTV